ncbi:MAG: serine hydrolase, partial [Stenotrophomonas sp.]
MRLTGVPPSLSHSEGEGRGGVGFFALLGSSASRLTPLLQSRCVGNAPAEHGSALPVLLAMERIGWLMRLKSFAVAVLLGFSTVAAARQPLPDAYAEQVFSLWFAAYNSGDRDALQTFLADYKVGQEAQRFLDIRQSLGTFKLLGVKSSTADNAQLILLSEMTDRGVLATLDMDPADPFDVTRLQLEGMELPDEFKPQRMSRTKALAAGRARLDAARAADSLSGALLVAKNGKVLLTWHGGAADRERAAGVDEATRFRLASLNKMFT